MAQLTKSQFYNFIITTLPDNSNREISALDLRSSFFNLADSIATIIKDEDISSLNFFSGDTGSTAVGVDSLSRRNVLGFNTTDNSAFGFRSLELAYSCSSNTAIGSYAASCNTLGSDNLALGVHSLGSITTGSGNIGVGNYSLMENKHGNFNIAIGHGAGYISPTTESFKFYLGSYPEASGDCDSYVAGLDKPPLLYGDLKTLQLAIGASGFRGAEKLSVSGDILPYESGGVFSLGSGEYRWNAHLQDIYVSGNVYRAVGTSFYTFKLSDGSSAADLILDNELVTISGVSGIYTDYKPDSNLMTISAEPISGFFNHELNSVSGLAPAFSGPSGLVWNVSGWAAAYADAVAAIAGLYTHWRIEDQSSIGENITDPSTTENTLTIAGVSGTVTNYRLDTNTLEISTQPLSGILHGIIGASGEKTRINYEFQDSYYNDLSTKRDNAISGTFMSLSGVEPAFGGPSGLIWNVSGWADASIDYDNLRASGLIDHVSGILFRIINASGNWNKDYTDQAIINANAFTHWTLSDQTQSTQIDSTNTLVIDPVSGILAEVIDIDEFPVLKISAQPISGVLQPQIITNDQRASGLISHTSGVLNRHTSVTSGVLDRYILATSGSLNGYTSDISGVFRRDIANIIEPIDGTIDSRITTYDTDIAKPYVNSLIDPIYTQAGLSGTLQYDIDTSDANASGLISFTSGVLDRFVDDASGVFNYDFYSSQGRLPLVSGYNQRYTDLVVAKLSQEIIEGYKGAWKAGDQTGTNVARINFEDILDFEGADGITTTIQTEGGNDIATVSHKMFINATPISGYLEDISYAITGIGGCFRTQLQELSGILREGIDASGLAISGWADSSFISYDQRASGLIETNNVRTSGLIDHVSGIIRAGIADSGYYFDNRASGLIDSVSGWAYNELYQISGWEPGREIYDVSGWVFKHVEKEILELDLINDNYSYWEISDGTTSRRIGSLRETQFLGISGIETLTKIEGSSGLYISAAPISGILHGIIDSSGDKIYNDSQTYLKNDYYENYVKFWANQQDNVFDERASGVINHVSGILNRHIDVTSGVLRNTIDASGLAISGWAHESFINYDNRASGLIDYVSGVNRNYAGTGLYRSSDGQFHTAGTGVFEKLALTSFDDHRYGNLITRAIIRNQSDPNHIIVNSSGFLAVPQYDKIADVETLNIIPARAGSGTIIFAGGHIRVSDGSKWNRPTVIEGFMEEDLEAPTDYSTPTSGKIVTRNEYFQASDVYYVTNRDHTFAASGGYFLTAMLINNEYRPTWSTCSGCGA